jgi:hypothetical protein
MHNDEIEHHRIRVSVISEAGTDAANFNQGGLQCTAQSGLAQSSPQPLERASAIRRAGSCEGSWTTQNVAETFIDRGKRHEDHHD